MKTFFKWLLVFLYSAFIYLTLPYAPDIIRALAGYLDNAWWSNKIAGILSMFLGKTPGGYEMIGWYSAILIIAVLLSLMYNLFKCCGIIEILVCLFRKYSGIFWFIIILAIYACLLRYMEVPTEKIHFIEYGFLAYFVLFALKSSITDRSIYFTAFFICYIIGLGDESTQHFIPGRHSEFADIQWNAIASGLILLMIAKSFPLKLEAKSTFKTRLTAMIFFTISIFCTAWYLNNISEYGYKIVDGSKENLYSRISPELMKNIENSQAEKFAALINNSDMSEINYDTFLLKFNAKDYPYIHEFRVHLFRRDRYAAYYEHYSMMNAAADNPSVVSPEAVKNSKFKMQLLNYIPKYIESPLAVTDDTAIDSYCKMLVDKAKDIRTGKREKRTEADLKNLLFIAYKENLIIEKYFGKTIALTSFKWNNEKNTIENLLTKEELDKEYESDVSSRIITGISKFQANLILFIVWCFVMFFFINIKVNAAVIPLLIILIFSGCAKRAGYIVKNSDSSIVIDGAIDETAWKKAREITEFYNIKTGEKTEGATKAKILCDKENIYVSFVCLDDYFFEDITERDGKVWLNDCVEIFIDSKGDSKIYYEFEVNPVNTVFDARIDYIKDNIDFNKAIKWDCPGFQTAVTKFDGGYSAEMKIPRNSIGLTEEEAAVQNPKFNVFRIDRNKKEEFIFYAWSKTNSWFHEPEFFRKLILR